MKEVYMTDYSQILTQYLEVFPDEAQRLSSLNELVSAVQDPQIIDRKHLPGHMTASAFVVSLEHSQVLLIYHNILQRYVQPGGHIDLEDAYPLAAAMRELDEETGIDAQQLTCHQACAHDAQVPMHVAVHRIPANAAKQEAAHEHYDLQYVFWCEDCPEVYINEAESAAYAWVDLDELQQIEEFEQMAQKIRRALLKQRG